MYSYTLDRGQVKSLGKMMYRTYYINSGALIGETQWDVSTTQGARRMNDRKRSEKTDYKRALPYVIYDPIELYKRSN